MADIKVRKKNETSLHIDTDPGIMQEIVDHFTFTVPNAKFDPRVKNKLWDGKIRLASYIAREVPVGLLDNLIAFANTSDYSIDESEIKRERDDVSEEEIRQFCESLQLTGGSKRIEIRDYQLNAVVAAIQRGRIILLSSTGSGKSLIIYCIIRWHLSKGRKPIIVVPTTSLVEQLHSDFADYSQLNNWNVKKDCLKIYEGKTQGTEEAKVVISTWQSIYKLPKSWFAKYSVVIGDECHLFKAKSLTSILNNCVNAKFRVGTTGSLDDTKTNQMVLNATFGPIFQASSTKDLIESKHLSDLKIFCVILSHSEEARKAFVAKTYAEEMEYLVKNEKRNKFIRNLALKQKQNVLVLFQFVQKHGDILYKMIKESAEEGRKIYYINGDTETEERERIRRDVESDSNAIIIASYGTYSTGINIKNLHNIIFASPTKSKIRNLQSIGRGLRISDSKTQCTLYDIGDDLTRGKKKNTTLLHVIERIKLYNEEGFSYKQVKVNI